VLKTVRQLRVIAQNDHSEQSENHDKIRGFPKWRFVTRMLGLPLQAKNGKFGERIQARRGLLPPQPRHAKHRKPES